jgi:hypothetical protein
MSRKAREIRIILRISADLVPEDSRVGNVDGASLYLDEASAVQTAQVSRNEFPYGSKPSGEFLIVFQEFELNSARRLVPGVVRHSQEVCDETSPNSRKRQFFN